jgi:hypothetical protein
VRQAIYGFDATTYARRSCRSAPLILTAGFAIGIVLSMHTRASLERFGAEAMIPAGLAIALIRETGPLTAGLLVAGRVGAGIGAEIGVQAKRPGTTAPSLFTFYWLLLTSLKPVLPSLKPVLQYELHRPVARLAGHQAE